MAFVKNGCGKYNLKSVTVSFALKGFEVNKNKRNSWDLNAFKINEGTCVFKGTRVPMNKLANNTQFYVSNENTAGIYASGGYACTFKTKKDHFVIVLNKTNLKKIIKILTFLQSSNRKDLSKTHITQLKTDIRQAYGINTTRDQQWLYFVRTSPSNRHIFHQIYSNKTPGRVSLHSVDKRIMTGLEWLFKTIPNKRVEGLYSPKKHSPAHGGTFHPEIAYFKASNILTAHGCKRIN